MPVSTATVTTTNMELTPMRVTFNGVDLGGTLGNVVVSTKFTKADIKADQSGTTIRDRRVSGTQITITTELAEVQNMDIWKVVFPHAKEVGTGPKAMYFQTAIGDSDIANSHNLILHPLSLANTNLNYDYLFYRAVASAESEIVYGPTEQAKLKIVWNVLPDDSLSPERFFFHGDPAIGLVHASFTSPVYSGTGNGTMTAVTVFDGFTKTENVVATAVTAVTNGGVFEVHGSITGPMGLATVGVTFNAPGGQISFHINDGTSDFIVGDNFTIATVASNYA